jgi:hypothetical protein
VADLPEALRTADLADRVQSLDTALAALQVAVTKRLLVAESQLCSIETKLLVPPPHARVVDELLRDLHGLKAALVLLQQKVDEVETRQGPSISMRDQLDLAGAVQRISNDLSKISTAVKRLDTSVRELQVSRGPSALPTQPKLAPASSTVAALTGLPDTDAAVEPPPDESARAASAQLAAAQAGGSVVEGVCVATLEGHREAVFQCCYSPSGATVLSSSQVRVEAFIGPEDIGLTHRCNHALTRAPALAHAHTLKRTHTQTHTHTHSHTHANTHQNTRRHACASTHEHAFASTHEHACAVRLSAHPFVRSQDTTLKLWDATTGSLQGSLEVQPIPPTSAPRWGAPRPQLRRAHSCHISTGTGLTPTAPAPELGSPLPHLHQDWAHPCHICTGTVGCSVARSMLSLGRDISIARAHIRGSRHFGK